MYTYVYRFELFALSHNDHLHGRVPHGRRSCFFVVLAFPMCLFWFGLLPRSKHSRELWCIYYSFISCSCGYLVLIVLVTFFYDFVSMQFFGILGSIIMYVLALRSIEVGSRFAHGELLYRVVGLVSFSFRVSHSVNQSSS